MTYVLPPSLHPLRDYLLGRERRQAMSDIPDDLRTIATHLSHRFHRKELDDDLSTAIAKLLMEERRRCAAVAETMSDTMEVSPGIYRKTRFSDGAAAIRKPAISPRMPTKQ